MDLCEMQNNAYRHPWEISRSDSVLKFCIQDKEVIFADIGAGDCYFLSKLCKGKVGEAYAVDSGYKNKEVRTEQFILLNDIKLLPNQKIECFIMMDVLEHVEDEDVFLEELLKKMCKNGKIIITVPAFQFLFSSHDSFLRHFRRYKKSKLKATLLKHNIVIENSFYFYSSLYCIRFFEKLVEVVFGLQKKNIGVGGWKYANGSIITKAIVFFLNLDFYCCYWMDRMGLTLPGLSLFAECRINHDIKKETFGAMEE